MRCHGATQASPIETAQAAGAASPSSRGGTGDDVGGGAVGGAGDVRTSCISANTSKSGASSTPTPRVALAACAEPSTEPMVVATALASAAEERGAMRTVARIEAGARSTQAMAAAGRAAAVATESARVAVSSARAEGSRSSKVSESRSERETEWTSSGVSPGWKGSGGEG